ncbi:MAG TPA: FHA domain-containing protein [Pirellulales bacterium]|nr:FHA domain-containing protein [Pirellulales bacterium]
MSLIRLVYYSGVIGGWAALVGWVLAEWLYYRHGEAEGVGELAVVGGLVGAAIGLGLNVVAGLANGQWKQLVFRAVPGLAAGAMAGAVGTAVGETLFRFGLPRACGWMILGLGVGAVEGLYDLAPRKLRNGLIGGALGGLLGGFLFDPIGTLVGGSGGSGMSSRAAGFVILGLAVGALIGLAQVVLREAWLTVLDGYRAGRQLILSQPVTCLGRGDHLPLPFLGPMNAELESEHTRIARQANGSYVVEDNHSRLGTRLNNQAISAPTVLKDGDVIKIGTNFVRFNERQRRTGGAPAVQPGGFQGQVRAAPPPPVRTAPPPAKPAAMPPKSSVAGPAVAPPTPTKPAASPPATPPRPGGIRPPPPPRRPKP